MEGVGIYGRYAGSSVEGLTRVRSDLITRASTFAWKATGQRPQIIAELNWLDALAFLLS